ncbi:type IV secretory system conjugative DNA transfer family protein [Candidatus Uhrbacteria bacterium]|nr:type IV secretory system conjugative DNA transfer family protein [Candidatus Uhrbacteria bacterium]
MGGALVMTAYAKTSGLNTASDLSFAPYLVVAAILAAIVAVAFFVARSMLRKKSRQRGGAYTNVTLMVTIPKFRSEEEAKGNDTQQTVKESIAIAETFFSAVGGLKPEHGLKAWLYGRPDSLALEIVAHAKLVTFFVTVPRYLQEFIEQQLHAQYSDAHIEPVEDYNLFAPTGTVLGGYLTLKRQSVFPLKTYKELDSDPMNALTNALSKVQEGDGVAVQYIVRPAHHGWRELGAKIVRNMNNGMTLEEATKGKSMASWFATKEDVEKKKEEKRERKLSQAEQKMVEGIGNKISKAGMEVNVRVVSSAQSADTALANLNNVLQAFSQYNIYEYGNSFSKVIPPGKGKLIDAFIFRTFEERQRVILNTEEMASLWHLPLPSTDTPNIRWMLARVAPAPTNTPTEGLLLGFNTFRGVKKDVYLKNGKGVAVIDPHGDLADGLLELIPKHRYDDVIYFNPSDMERPMGLNMLEAPNEQMRDFAVQEMISIFYMLFPPEMIGPMFEHNMRNYMLTLMADVEHPGTIVEIPRMIADEKFQQQWVAKVKDPVVRSFWEDEMAKTSDYHKSEMMGYLVSKVGRFVENEMMRNIIGQSKSAFNFREIMDEGKILLVNLSKGKTGEVNGNLLGLILVAKLQMAAFTRADIPEPERKDFYLYIDEFQNFVTPSIATILSEARKYRLNLVMAHQYMGQLVKDGRSEIRDAVLGNVGSMFVSRIGPEDTEVLAKIYEPTFSPYDLMNNEAYSWNAKIIIDNSQEKPFTLKAYPPEKGKPKVGEALKEISRLLYGRDKGIVEREITIRAGLGMKPPVKPVAPVSPPSL